MVGIIGAICTLMIICLAIGLILQRIVPNDAIWLAILVAITSVMAAAAARALLASLFQLLLEFWQLLRTAVGLLIEIFALVAVLVGVSMARSIGGGAVIQIRKMNFGGPYGDGSCD
jgi:hypothetical protein